MNNVAAGADGGRMQYATVNMEEGHDTLIVEGYNHTNQPAIVGSSVSMGVGNDTMMVGGGYYGRNSSIHDSTIDMGAGDDFFSMGGYLNNSTVLGGSGIDTFEYTSDKSQGDVSIYIQEGIAIL